MSKNASLFIIVLIALFYSVESVTTFLKKASNKVSELELEILKSSAYEAFCFLNINGTVYDLNSLNIPNYDYNSTDSKYTIYYNFCNQASQQCTQKNTTALAVMTSNVDKNICYSLGGSKTTLSKWNFINDTDTNQASLELVLSQGEVCKNDPSKNYETIYQVVCDQNATTPRFDSSSSFNSDSCLNKIKVYSNAGCPQLNFYSIFNTIVSNKYIFGPILIGLGIFLCFFGNYFYFVLSLIVGVLLVSFVILFLIFTNVNIAFSTVAFWIVMAVVVIVGILVGYFLSKHEWIIDFSVAGFCGYLLGLFLYNFILNKVSTNPKVVFWCTIVASIILLIFLVWLFKEFIVISSTSFIGAYAIIRGLSLIFGGFPDEQQVMDLISRGDWAQVKLLLSSSVYMYLTGFVILALAGTVIQYMYFRRNKDNKDSNEKKENNQEEKEKFIKK